MIRLKGDRVSGVLPREFFARHTLEVARDLVGKLLVVRADPEYALEDPRSKTTSGIIVETEAYRADDPASHSCRGETPRNRVMFGEAGVAYVYFIYGNYEMLNFVTEPRGAPGAVLIRAVQPVTGLALMQRQRPRARTEVERTNGPGKLCAAMGVRLSHNGESLRGPSLFVAEGREPVALSVSPRVGIREGVEAMWRFFETDNDYVSRAPQNREARPLKGVRHA